MKSRPNFASIGDMQREGIVLDNALYVLATNSTMGALEAIKKDTSFHHSFDYMPSCIDTVRDTIRTLESGEKYDGRRAYFNMEAMSMNINHGFNLREMPEVVPAEEKVYERLQKISHILSDEGVGPRGRRNDDLSPEAKKQLKTQLRFLLLETAQFMHDYSEARETEKVTS